MKKQIKSNVVISDKPDITIGNLEISVCFFQNKPKPWVIIFYNNKTKKTSKLDYYFKTEADFALKAIKKLKKHL
jgi:hypothetical protein